MDDLSSLLCLCTLMFVLTFLVGYLPMTMKLSEKHLESISVLGAGFLLGTSLIVILPEGLTVLMEVKGILSESHSHSHSHSHEHEHNSESETSHSHEHAHSLNNDQNANDASSAKDNNDNWSFFGRHRRLFTFNQQHSQSARNDNNENNHNNNNNDNIINNYLLNENKQRNLQSWEFDSNYNNNNRHLNDDDHSSHHDHNHDSKHEHNDNDGHDHNNDESNDEHGHHHSHDPRIHAVFREMGIIVCFGFVFMMGIEKLSGGDHGHDHSHGHSHGHTHSHDASHSKIEHSHQHSHSHSTHGQNGHSKSHGHSNVHETEMETLMTKSGNSMTSSPNIKTKIQVSINNEKNTNNNTSHFEESAKNKQRTQTTKLLSFMVGLLTHAAVDGIALGAVSAEGNAQSLSLLVFIALMGHKAPAAVSVTTFLKRKAHPRKEIIKQIVAFSAAAPVFALLTYFILDTLFIDLMGGSLGGSEALGWCLLFSGGTFLYVVTLHILPEIKSWRSAYDFQLSWKDILLLTIGVIVPSFFEHSH